MLIELQQAILAARIRTGDETISTRTNSGYVQICRVTYDKEGVSTVTPLTSFILPTEAIDRLNSMRGPTEDIIRKEAIEAADAHLNNVYLPLYSELLNAAVSVIQSFDAPHRVNRHDAIVSLRRLIKQAKGE